MNNLPPLIRRLSAAALGCVLAALALSACGSDDGDDSGDSSAASVSGTCTYTAAGTAARDVELPAAEPTLSGEVPSSAATRQARAQAVPGMSSPTN